MLKIENIIKKYSNSIVLNNISFKLPQNSIIGIIGPNGAGKTTLLNIITGFEVVNKGKIFLNDKELVSFNEKKLLFSYMPEELQVYPEYYVRDFISFLHNTTQYYNKLLIDTLQLEKVMNKKIRYLSKGYHQRLKLYFALSNNKKIIFLDEPFNGFDPIQLIEILDLLKLENKKERTFIISIHQLFDAEKICDYYILLNEGRLIAKGSMQKLKKIYGKNCNSLEEIFIKALI